MFTVMEQKAWGLIVYLASQGRVLWGTEMGDVGRSQHLEVSATAESQERA